MLVQVIRDVHETRGSLDGFALFIVSTQASEACKESSISRR